jgi:hypothetical protein
MLDELVIGFAQWYSEEETIIRFAGFDLLLDHTSGGRSRCRDRDQAVHSHAGADERFVAKRSGQRRVRHGRSVAEAGASSMAA